MKDPHLARLLADPRDEEAHLVYADALIHAGDPRGELIVLQHHQAHATDDVERAILGAAVDEYLTKHRAALLGPLDKDRGTMVELELGFLRRVRLFAEGSTAARLEAILALPCAQLLDEVVVFGEDDEEVAAARALVAKHSPRTSFTEVQLFDELAPALEAGDRVRWLGLRLRGAALPDELWTLRNLEYLDLGGSDMRTLPAAISGLRSLHRLDLNWCRLLEGLPDELFAIETLRYVSMYECFGLRDRFHMADVNNLLAGFERMRTPARRRALELHLMLGDATTSAVADLLAALDSNVAAVRKAALAELAKQLPDPRLAQARSLAVIGKTNFTAKTLGAQLAAHGITLAKKIDDATTHVLLGERPGLKRVAAGDRPIVLEPHLTALFERGATTAEPARDDLRTQLASRDEKTTSAALATLAALPAVPPELLVDLLVVVQDVALAKSRTQAKKLFALAAPPAVAKAVATHLKSSLLLESMGETKRAERIIEFCAATKGAIDPGQLARLLAMRAGVGLGYLMAHGTRADVEQLFERVLSDGVLDLRKRELRELPASLGAVRDRVTSLVLCENSLPAFPPAILELTHLRALDLANNWIKSLPDELAALPLRALDLAGNGLSRFPTAILGLARLEELELSSSQYNHGGANIAALPADIGRLAALRTLTYRCNVIEQFPPSFFTLQHLEELDLIACTLPAEIPPALAQLRALTRLDVSETRWAGELRALKKLLPSAEVVA